MFAHIKRSGTVAVQLTVIITLALVTGPSVVLVAYLSAIVTGRVPIPDSEDVYAIHSTSSAQAPEGFRRDGLSFPEFADIRDALASIPIVGVVPTDVTLDLVEMPTAARVGAVTRGYFSILGVRSTLGHVLSSDVGETTAEPVLVLSERLWRQRLHGDPDVIGRGVRLNNTRFGIVGVAGKDFLGGSRGESIDAWIPLGALGLAGGDTTLLGYRDARTMLVYARLQSSGQLPELVQRLRAVSQTLDIAYPVTNSGRVFHARSIESSVAQWRANTLVQLLFLAITTLTVVILLAVSNLTNVYVALSIQRARDTAVELALGATKFRLLVRSILDASRSTMIGCGLGTIFGAVTLSLLRGKDYVQGTDARVDPVTVLYAAAIGIIAACTIAGGASTNALKMDLAARLRTAHTTTPKTTRHLQGTLVAAQLAAATLLAYVAIVAAGRAVVLTRVDPGYDVERIMHAHLDLSRQLYTLDERTLLHTRLVQELGSIPGVRGVGVSGTELLAGGSPFARPVSLPQTPNNIEMIPATLIGPGYFGALGVPLRRGRELQEADCLGSNDNVIVSETMARQLWPSGDAVGKAFSDRRRFTRRVVGIVADIRIESVEDNQNAARWYACLQNVRAERYHIYVRSDGDPRPIITSVARILTAVDPGAVASSEPTPLGDVRLAALRPYRVTAGIAQAFALLALLVSCVGVYGTTAQRVAERAMEFGIRKALGASPSMVVRLVLSHGLRAALVGCGIGLAASSVASRELDAVLGPTPSQWPIALCVIAVLMVTAAAGAIPAARKAARTDPAQVMRAE